MCGQGDGGPTGTEATTVYPDIVVHQRGVDDDNRILIEVKVHGRRGGANRVKHDRSKLALYRLQLKYQYAFVARDSISGVPGVPSMFRVLRRCSGRVPGAPSTFRVCSGCSVDVPAISAPSLPSLRRFAIKSLLRAKDIMYRYREMIKTSNNHRITHPSKLKLNRETLRVIGDQDLVKVVGGASAGVNSAICTVTNLSRDIGCCTL